MVPCINMHQPQEQSSVSPKRTGREVQSWNEAEQPYQYVDDPEYLIKASRPTSEGGRDADKPTKQMNQVVDNVHIEYTEECLYSGAILCWYEKADNTYEKK